MKSRILLLFFVLIALVYLLTNEEVKKNIASSSLITNQTIKNIFSSKNQKNNTSLSSDKTSNNEIHKNETQLNNTLPQNFGNQTVDEVQAWIKNESQTMNSTQHNTSEKELELTAQAQTLTKEQIEALTKSSLDPNGEINYRILSAYLISLISEENEESIQAKYNIAKSQIPDNGPIEPHSENEVKRTQELAIRYMEIDQLFSQAKINSNAYNKLKLLTSEAESPEVRSYALRKLKELSN